MTLFSRKREYFIVSLLLISFYFSIILSFGYFHKLNDIMFWSPDSQTYRAVGNWLCGLDKTNTTLDALLIRPFFYPLFLNLSRSFGGVYGVWFFQFLMWVSGGLLIYYVVKNNTGSAILALGSSFIYGSNLTLILITLHALTETMTTFLLTILVFLISDARQHQKVYWPLVIFVTALLTVTKPVYVLLLIGVLGYWFYLLIQDIYYKKNKFGKTHYSIFLYVILALLPVFIQISIMKTTYNRFTISEIGSRTIKGFYFARLYKQVNHVSMQEAWEKTKPFDKKRAVEFILKHYKFSIPLYFTLIKENLVAGSNFVNYPRTQKLLDRYMKILNKIYYYFHLLMIIPLAWTIISLAKKKKKEDLEIIVFLAGVLYLVIFTSGVTFGQGDRIVLPTLPVWITLYALLITKFNANFARPKIKTQNTT